jgi:8-oxo-dGTP pyrophosphatase MutT (NUDIX family)
MPHIHRFYDWVVSVFIVHRGKALLCFHKKYKEWLPVGGHVDLNEDPEQALFKEIREECGLKVRILADKPSIAHPGVKPVYTPSYVDVHRIKGVHKHIALIYFGVSSNARVKLEEREFHAYKWLSKKELSDKALKLTKSIRFYSLKALEAASRKG